MDQPDVLIDVVIPTVDRNELLVGAVQGALRQEVPFAEVRIIVVDNSAAGSQCAIVQPLAPAPDGRVELRCVHEPRPGLAYARNKGIAASEGDFVVFLDDDENPLTRDWLARLVSAAIEEKADAAFGPVVAQFETPPQHYADFVTNLYSRDTGRVYGADVTKLVATLGTGNSCFRRATCFGQADEPFDHRFDKTGGEDIDLLHRLHDRGRRFVWAAGAAVGEFVPRARLERGYLSDRRFRQGQQRSYLQIAAAPRRYDALLFWMAVGAAQTLYHASAGSIARLFGRDDTAERHAIQYWGGVGKVLWQARHREEHYGVRN